MAQEFLGVGWKYPVQLNQERVIERSQYEQKVRESIWIILSTAPGERVMRPNFGCGIHAFVFAPNNTRTLGLVQFQVEQALTRWEPRIDLERVEAQSDIQDPAKLLISIDYRLRGTDSRFNMVYPFYLQREETA